MAGKDKGRCAPGTPPRTLSKPVVRAEMRSDGPGYSVVVSLGKESVDVTGSFTATVAHALWQLRGGPDVDNWVDAERLMLALVNDWRTTRPLEPIPSAASLSEVRIPGPRKSTKS